MCPKPALVDRGYGEPEQGLASLLLRVKQALLLTFTKSILFSEHQLLHL